MTMGDILVIAHLMPSGLVLCMHCVTHCEGSNYYIPMTLYTYTGMACVFVIVNEIAIHYKGLASLSALLSY